MNDRSTQSLTKPARIVLVDDHPLMREGLAIQISAQQDMEVCGQAEDVRGALELVKQHHPDLLIIDLSLKESNGLDLIKNVKSRFPNIKMLVLSAYEESIYAERALRAGAMGYLNKQQASKKIFEAIRTLLAGDRYISEETTRRLVGQAIGASVPTASPIEKLTNRELEVFQLLGKGFTTNAVATRLHLSVHTIESHREKIKTKLNLKNATELQYAATQWILENG